MKKGKLIYCILFFAICLCPSLGMLVTKQETSSENRQLSEFPSPKTEEGKINVEWLSQAGDYFQEHFAFRNELVTGNALLHGRLLETSTADGVIQGKNGWLYYKDSLDDYLGQDLLSDRSLFNIAHMLSMTQQALEEKGVNFLFTIAPNKNSLYGDNMPYYDKLKVSGQTNRENLEDWLKTEKVAYADLYQALMEENEVLYHARDSHWNNKGAALAADVLMDALGKDHDSYDGESYTVRRDYTGDLDTMLYPLASTADDEIYYDKETTYATVEEIQSNFDPRITTVNPVKEGSLVMYRDSFGNALLPYMADAYANAYFSRGIPYQLMDVETHSADTVIIERAERFLPEMSQFPPVLTAKEISLTENEELQGSDGAVDVKIKPQGMTAQLSGRIKEGLLDTDSRIYLKVNGSVYEAFPMDVKVEENLDDNGFCLYLPSELVAADGNDVEILIEKDNKIYNIYQNNIKEDSIQ
ncbi:alginate O-acetyltransferase AlgX-related protein [Blautia difficilis]|uniref:alginate O-acetyltransferase AlgX-related protein n=1 Tax=Blautia difficilis TaxID=2763027 RepID=UPI003D97D124